MENKNTGCTLSLTPGFIMSMIFMVLKLCNVIDWSWWWVFSPMWISFGIVLVLVIIWFILMILLESSKFERY